MKETGTTILVIEDEEHDVEFLRRAFERAGVPNPIQWVTNGAEAIDYIRGHGKYGDRKAHPFPRVVITDLKMPQMSGIEFLQWIHANPHYRIVPTLILTSSTREADIQLAFAHGACGYMVKPVDFPSLERMARVIADYWRLSLSPTGSDRAALPHVEVERENVSGT